MSVKMFSGYKFEGSFEEFQAKCFSLINDLNFINLLKEQSNKIYDIIYEDIFYKNKENKSKNIIVKAFLNYLYHNKDNKKFNFSKFKSNEEYKGVFYTFIKRLDTKIYYQMVDGVIYLWIKANDIIIKFITDYFSLTDYCYWDNVDKDPAVSSREWNNRKNFWVNKWNNEVSFEFEIFNFIKDSNLLLIANKIIKENF